MSVLIEEKEYRGLNCIRLQQIGNKKEHWIRFEVGPNTCSRCSEVSYRDCIIGTQTCYVHVHQHVPFLVLV